MASFKFGYFILWLLFALPQVAGAAVQLGTYRLSIDESQFPMEKAGFTESKTLFVNLNKIFKDQKVLVVFKEHVPMSLPRFQKLVESNGKTMSSKNFKKFQKGLFWYQAQDDELRVFSVRGGCLVVKGGSKKAREFLLAKVAIQ